MAKPAQSPFGPYKRTGHRVSLLPLTRFCGHASKVADLTGHSRAAAVSSAYHAKMAGEPKAARLLALLTDEERATVESWATPVDLTFVEANDNGQGSELVTLAFADAEKEVLVGCDDYGGWADPTTQDVFLRGYVDFYWIVTLADGRRVLYVVDIKKGRYTASGPDSLQLLPYAFALASKHQCDAFVTGLWIAEDGEYWWSPAMVDLQSQEAARLWMLVMHAAMNRNPEPVTGAHCGECFGRLKCVAWTLPAAHAETILGPACEGAPITPDAALKLVLHIQAVEKTLEQAKKHMQEYVKRGGVVADPTTGKVWGPVKARGREKVDLERLKTDLGDDWSKYVSRGEPSVRIQWLNPKKK